VCAGYLTVHVLSGSVSAADAACPAFSKSGLAVLTTATSLIFCAIDAGESFSDSPATIAIKGGDLYRLENQIMRVQGAGTGRCCNW
jgi:hypothetical protein